MEKISDLNNLFTRSSKRYATIMSLKSGKRKLLVDGSRRGNNKDADRGRRSVEKSGGDRGRSLERGTEGGSSSSSRPSVFSRLGTKIQGQVPAQPPARLSGEGILFFSVLRIRIYRIHIWS